MKHLGIGTYPFENGINPYVVYLGAAYGSPVGVAIKTYGTEYDSSDSSGLFVDFLNWHYQRRTR